MTNRARPRACAIVAACLFALSTSGYAQSSTKFGIAAGVTAPLGDYGNDKDVGYHLGILFDAPMRGTPLGFRVDGAFHELKYTGNSTKAQIFMASTSAMLKLPTGSFVSPYLIGGAGIYNSQRTLFLTTRSRTDFGVNIGGGIRFELTEVTTFIEARYHRVAGDGGPKILPITFGVLF